MSDRSDKYLSDLSDNFTPLNYTKTYSFPSIFVRLLPSGAELQPSRLFGDGRGEGCPARDCLRSCALDIESDGAGGPALSPAGWPALGAVCAQGCSSDPPTAEMERGLQPPLLTAGWVGPPVRLEAAL